MMVTSVTSVIGLLTMLVRTSDQFSGLYDCRFWSEPKQEMAARILTDLSHDGESVFYWWDATRAECLPCSVCPERTLSLCWYVRDTQCVSQKDWLLMHRQSKVTSSSSALKDVSDKSDVNDNGDGVVVFRSHADKEDQQPAVFGVPVYTTDDSVDVLRDTPTRRVHNKYRVKNRNMPPVASEPEEEQFGTPTFFSKDDKVSETVQRDPAKSRPILTILRDMLDNNKSHGLGVKDVANATGARAEHGGHGHYGSGAGDRVAQHFIVSSEQTTLRSNTAPNIYKHTQYSVSTFSVPASTPKYYSPRRDESLGEQEYDANYDTDYGDRFKQIWPYRTDDKYSLFYFHPNSNGDDQSLSEKDSKVYPWPSLNDNDEVYDDPDHSQSNSYRDTDESSSERSLIPLLSQDEYLNSSETLDNTQVLENILYGVTSLVVILVIILIYVSVKTRLSQNRFKLLDNSDNISSYQSVSPADTILPAATTPSPLPSRSVSPAPTITGVHRNSVSPTVPHGGTVYDRSKLSIPLQRYNVPSSSSSSSPSNQNSFKSPSNCSPLNPSVARSLKNIKQSASKNDIQHIELDFNSRLF